MNEPGQPTAPAATAAGQAAETVPIEHEARERLVRIVFIGVPIAALGATGWLTAR